jgi:hypothetical protein
MNAKQHARGPAERLRVRRLEIVDDDDVTRIELGTSTRGDAVVRLRDAKGTVRALISTQDETPRIRLLDSTGQARLCAILRNDSPGIELLGSDGQPRMVMFLRDHENEGPDIYFNDGEGEPRFGVAMDHAGRIALASKDDAGRLREALWSSIEGDGGDEPLA